MKQLLIFSTFLVLSTFCKAQLPIIQKANIEFERKVNVWADLTGSFADEMKKNIPEYQTSFFNFESDGNKAIYKPGKEVPNARNNFFRSPASDNIVYSDYAANQRISMKNVFEKTYLIEDSLRDAKWKITNDYREIAGFNCRRATTIIMDSVFVVAFYTDEIMISGGPESFNGLPGMIMGLVINRLHTTWYATSVNVTDVNVNNIQPPKGKAEKITMAKLTDIISKLFSNWGGSNRDRGIWALLI